MSNIVRQNENNLITTFTIDEPNKQYVNINDIIIYNDFYNSVDYNSNYFAYITSKHIDNNNPSYMFNTVNNTNTNISLLNIVRVPVQQYSRQTLIDNINASYINSLWDIHKRAYVNESTITYPSDENIISNSLWYSYRYDNIIKPELNAYTCYDISNIDTTNYSIDVSTSNNTIKYTADNYTMVLNGNREIYISNGDNSLYYNSNTPIVNKYELHIRTSDKTMSEADILENITTNITYHLYLTSANDTFTDKVVWYNDDKQLSQPDSVYDMPVIYNSAISKYIVSYTCKDTDGNTLAKLTLRLRNRLTEQNIKFVSDYEGSIDKLNLAETDSVYVQVDKDSCSFKSINVSGQYENINIDQTGKNKFTFTTPLDSLEDTTITFTLRDYYNNVITKTLTIYKDTSAQTRENQGLTQGENQGLTQGESQGLTQGESQGLTQGESQGLANDEDKEMTRAATYTPTYKVFDDAINSGFFSKITNGVISMVIIDLPIIYMFGVDASNSGNYLVLKLDMDTFIYKVFSTSTKPMTGNYTFTSSNNRYGLLLVGESLEEIIKQNHKLITSYDDNTITFSEDLLPVSIVSNHNSTRINKRTNDNYYAYTNTSTFAISNSEITLLNIDSQRILASNNLFFTSFGYVKHNTMTYLNIPTQTIVLDNNTVFNYPVIYGNYVIQYLLKDTTPRTLTNKYKVVNRQSFINTISLKVLYSYVDDLDNVVNNIHDITNVYFNVLASFEIADTNKTEHRLNVSKRVSLSKGKINIYIISNKLKWCVCGKDNVLTYSI